jgi:hypothetical protein
MTVCKELLAYMVQANESPISNQMNCKRYGCRQERKNSYLIVIRKVSFLYWKKEKFHSQPSKQSE